MKKGYVKCPFCANEIKEGAVKCQFCEEFLDGRNKKNDINYANKPVKFKKNILLLIVGILLILFLGWFLLKNYNQNDVFDDEEINSNSILNKKDAECKESGKAGIRSRLYELYGFQSGMGIEDEIITDEDHTISNIDYFYSKKTDECLYSYILTNHHNGHVFLEIEKMSYGESLYDKLAESDDDYIEWRNMISYYKDL